MAGGAGGGGACGDFGRPGVNLHIAVAGGAGGGGAALRVPGASGAYDIAVAGGAGGGGADGSYAFVVTVARSQWLAEPVAVALMKGHIEMTIWIGSQWLAEPVAVALRLQPASRTSHVSTLHPWRRNRNLVFHGIGEVVSPRTIATIPPVGGEVGGMERNATPP